MDMLKAKGAVASGAASEIGKAIVMRRSQAPDPACKMPWFKGGTLKQQLLTGKS